MTGRLKCLVFFICQLSVLSLCSSQHYYGDRCRDSFGQDGICKFFEECPTAQSDLNRGTRPTACGFHDFDPIVCCPNLRDDDTNTQITRKVGEAAKYWCEQYSRPCPFVFGVAGGERALPSEFPHMAAVGFGDEYDIIWSCGGSLISEKFVLTAAHCLRASGIGPARWVLLGAELLINSTSSRSKKGQIHPVIQRIRHPDYKPPSKYNDVALLEIGPALTPNALPLTGRYLHPACLPTDYWIYPHHRAVATGWGRVGFGEDGSPDLLKVELDIFELSKCNQLYEVEIKTTKWFQRGIDSNMLCAGVLEGGKDTCQGDSGGPLQHAVIHDCKYEVWGITSFGKICAFKNSPAVYMRVSEYVPWIESVVWPITT